MARHSNKILRLLSMGIESQSQIVQSSRMACLWVSTLVCHLLQNHEVKLVQTFTVAAHDCQGSQ